MNPLFSPITLRELTVKNRIWLPPMCQYSADDGVVGDWHLAHYGSFAVGGFGLLIAEATAVVPEGRISRNCAGLWADGQVNPWRRVVDFVHQQGAKIAVQIAHAGRKGSSARGWEPPGTVSAAEGGWQTVGPTDAPFPGYAAPRALSTEEVAELPASFAAAAARADAAGFDAVEIHAAHGYLMHEFLSPLTNTRGDRYGGSAENRARLLVETVAAVRAALPSGKPVFVRVSASDWLPGGLTPADVSAALDLAKPHGVDLADVSSGGLLPALVDYGPGYQVGFAREVRSATGLPTAAVGLITAPPQAEEILREGSADVVLIGRAALGDPHWPLRAASQLLGKSALDSDRRQNRTWPVAQYARGCFG